MFYGFVITEGGNALLASMVAGQTLIFTRVIMDKGTAESIEAARAMTAPIDPGPEATSSVPTVDGNAANMIVEYRSDMGGGLQEGFWIGGFAIYGKVETGEETMIGYGSLGDTKQYVSAYVAGTAPDVRRYPISITVTTGVQVAVNYPAEAWMTAEDVAQYISGMGLDGDGYIHGDEITFWMGQTCPGGPLKLEDIQGNTVLGGTPAYDAPVSMESVEGPLKLHISGKNLIDISKATKTGTTSGVSYSISDDGAISLSGVCDRPGGAAYIMPFGDDSSKAFYLPAGTYCLSGLNTDYAASKAAYMYLNCYGVDGDNVVSPKPTTYGPAGVSFVLPDGGAWVTVNVAVKDGTDMTGVTITPQIEVGNEATDYEEPSNTTVEIPLLGTDGQELEPLRMAYTGTSASSKTAWHDRIVRKDGLWCVMRSAVERDLTDAVWSVNANYAIPTLGGSQIKDGTSSYFTLSTHFASRGENGNAQDDGTWFGTSLAVGNQVLPNGADTTAEEMGQWCAAQAEAGTPVRVCYVLAQPIFEELHQDVQVLLNTLSVPGSVCSVWFEGDVLPSGADIGLPRGDYPSVGLEGAYRWLEELSNPLPTPTTADLYAWALSQQRGGVFATSGAVTTQNVPESGNLTGILSVTEQGSAVSMLVFGPTGKLYSAKRAAGVWRGWVQIYSDLTPPPLMGGAAASQAGTAGLVPAPAAGAQGKYLRGDGTWQTPQDTTYDDATQNAAGLLSAADKIKLDGIDAGANHYTHPSYTARSSGLYKIAVDETGHISGAEATHTGRAARFVVGTSAAGWTAEDCDYLCDGTADDVEIKAAIAALPSGGGEVLLLDGTYNISSSITISKANVTLRGSGASTVLKRMFNGTSNNGVIGCSAADCRISSLTIDGNKSAYTSGNNRGVYASTSATNIRIDNVTVQNSYIGFGLSGMNGGSIVNSKTKACSSISIFISAASGIGVEGCSLATNGGNGITIEAAEDIRIINNRISNTTDYGINLNSRSKRGIITGNTIDAPRDDYSIGIYGSAIVVTDNVAGSILLGGGSKSNIAAHNITSQTVYDNGTDNLVESNTVYTETEEVTA